MKKYISTVIVFPLINIIICYTAAYLEHYTTQSFFLDIFGFAWLFGVLILNPIYLLIVDLYFINKYNINKWIVAIINLIIILLNASACCFESVLVYIGLKEWDANDVDLFPLYLVIPSVIYITGLVIYKMKNMHRKKTDVRLSTNLLTKTRRRFEDKGE